MKSTYFYALLYASAFSLWNSEAAKILGIFPFHAKSHFNCNNAIMKSLIDAGNEVTVITTFPEQASAENYSSIIDVSEKEVKTVGKLTFDEVISINLFESLNIVAELELPYCTKILNLPEIQKIFESHGKLYDVVFVEIIFFYKCFLPVAEKMKVPVIGTVTFRTWLSADHAIYNPNHPAYIPFEFRAQKGNLNRIFGRAINLWNSILILWFETFAVEKSIMQFHKDNAYQLGSLEKYVEMEPNLVFYNNHPSLFPRPMNPNAIEIGGIHINDAKPLPKNIQKFIDEANQGVILFSLGTIIEAITLPTHIKNAFKEAFAEIPQRVIWKYEGYIENLSSNVMTLEWLPQRDILEHNNVIAFISHCGLGSMNEAIYTGTPIIACPLFADQPVNAELLEDRGVAVYLNVHDITKENILNALNAIINDKKYLNNTRNLSKEFKDRQTTPQQNIVYWTDYVVKHNGAPYLKSPASRLSLFQFLMLDVILPVIFILIILLYLIYRVCRVLFLYLTRAFSKSIR